MRAIWYKKLVEKGSYERKLAYENVGYFHLEKWPPDLYAFRRPTDSPPPEGLIECDENEIRALEKLRHDAQNLHSMSTA